VNGPQVVLSIDGVISPIPEGGEKYEEFEENPMIGYRGASRYIRDIDIFRLASRVNRALAVNRRGVPTPIGTLSC